MTDIKGSTHLQSALLYAKKYGWRVFPVFGTKDGRCACGNAGCENAGKHPATGKGFKDATTDEATIIAWWTARPESNVGVACGEESGIFVVDVDVKHGDGAASLAAWWSEFGEFPTTLTEESASGGMHYFFQWPKDGLALPNRPGWLPSVDLLADGRYVIVAPSVTPLGLYRWTTGGVGPAYPPQMLLDHVRAGRGGSNTGPTFKPDVDELAFLANGPEKGKRNDTFYHFALKWLRLYRGDEGIVGGLIMQAYEKVEDKETFTPDELKRTFQSAVARYKAGLENDRDIADLLAGWSADVREGRQQAVNPLDVSAVQGGIITAPDGFPLTDLGNAERLVIMHGEKMRHCTGVGWLAWDGTRWCKDDADKVVGGWMDIIIRGILTEMVPRLVEREVSEDVVKAVMRHWRVSESPARVNAALQFAERKVSARAGDLDQQPHFLNVANGTVDLRTGELLGHDPSMLITKMAGTRWDPEAVCPKWMAFLERVVPDAELRRWVQKAVGYTLTGSVDEKCFFIVHGRGDNGKTLFTETLGLLMGDYWKAAPKSVFIGYGGKMEQHPTDLAGVAGARYVTCGEEVNQRDHLAEAKIKSMTGGNTMTARFMHQDFFEFDFIGKLWLDTNYRPKLSDFSPALQERIRMVPWDVVIPREERRPREEMLAEFAAELPGILKWAVEGGLRWRAEGLKAVEAVEEATADYVHDENLVVQFVEDFLELGEGFTLSKDLMRAYKWWMTEQGFDDRSKLSPRSLGLELRALGVEAGRDRQAARGWRVSLKRDVPMWVV